MDDKPTTVDPAVNKAAEAAAGVDVEWSGVEPAAQMCRQLNRRVTGSK